MKNVQVRKQEVDAPWVQKSIALLILLIGLTFHVFCTALRVIVLLDRRYINIV
jgi:hypothetical protein